MHCAAAPHPTPTRQSDHVISLLFSAVSLRISIPNNKNWAAQHGVGASAREFYRREICAMQPSHQQLQPRHGGGAPARSGQWRRRGESSCASCTERLQEVRTACMLRWFSWGVVSLPEGQCGQTL